MRLIICDISAWQYWRTPPDLSAVEIPRAIAITPTPNGAGLPNDFAVPHRRTSQAESLLLNRLLSDLKGVSPPVHVMLPEHARHSTSTVVAHRIPQNLPEEHLIDIGNGLLVTSPALTLYLSKFHEDVYGLAADLYEACGLYACAEKNKRTNFVLRKMLEAHNGAVLPAGIHQPAISAYCDENGKPLSFYGRNGGELPWQLCRKASGDVSDLWKRPPLTSKDELLLLGDQLHGARDARRFAKAMRLLHNGSGSPLETQAAIMLTAPSWDGGEGWPAPFLNRRVLFPDNAQRIAHQSQAVVDMLWPQQKICIELLGEAYHADRKGFKLESGRNAALQSLGYTIIEFTHEQLRDLELYDSLISRYAEMTGFQLSKRTPAFLMRRQKMHDSIFGIH